MSTDPISAIEFETLAFTRHITAAVGRARRDELVLEGSAYTLMTLLEAGGPASISTLSDITGLDASTLNRQTAALLRDGHVERIADPDGGIARIFRLTFAGNIALEYEQSHSRAALARTLAGWTPDEHAELARVLRRFNETTEQNYPKPWPRDTP
ncbi:DNA-binding MarR family transcriptional regulator [Leucobacter exalbidus]|uniref:DNA-binding MarR family transcriptional regulator n=1 Tax=Leucobacter exalbidus TaxID=662960 RepID=A0A940T3I8_9MICO|nr:MarR family winged helix-turn-helix transcriptional regulator [Leucobacter exalbidus]MBP1325799.1 DNA-binding MarR family transcriptional regulator [Leucobacter exalbidus]